MPLIPCPECRREVSDQAIACPQCGHPLSQAAPGMGAKFSTIDDELRRMIMGQPERLIETIKHCRELYPGMGLAEAKEHVESLAGRPKAAPGAKKAGCGGTLLVLIFAVLLMLGIWLAGCATSSTEGTAWHPLFDGKTLTGWTAPDMSFWSVQDGLLTGETTREHQPPRTQFLVWHGGEVRDFEMKFEFRIFGTGANSGMQFRSAVKEQGLVHGYQADLNSKGDLVGSLYDEYNPRASLAHRGERVVIDEAGHRTATRFAAAETVPPNLRTDAWNEYHITAVGPKITLRVNGVVTAEVEDRQIGEADAAGVLATAIIAGEPMKVQYRNLRLRKR